MKSIAAAFFFLLLTSAGGVAIAQDKAQDNTKQILDRYQAAALKGGDAKRGEVVFKSKQAACAKCHILSGKEKKAGPKLGTIGDKITGRVWGFRFRHRDPILTRGRPRR